MRDKKKKMRLRILVTSCIAIAVLLPATGARADCYYYEVDTSRPPYVMAEVNPNQCLAQPGE